MHKDLQIYQTLQTNIQLTSWAVFTWMLEMVREKNSFLGSEKTVRPDDVSRSGCDFTGFWVWRTDLEILPVLNSDTDHHHHQTLKLSGNCYTSCSTHQGNSWVVFPRAFKKSDFLLQLEEVPPVGQQKNADLRRFASIFSIWKPPPSCIWSKVHSVYS